MQTQLHTAPSFSSSSSTPYAIIERLAYKVDEIRHPQARACLLWLVGQYAAANDGEKTVVEGIKDWAPDVLRKVAKSFRDEVRFLSISQTCQHLYNLPLSCNAKLLTTILTCPQTPLVKIQTSTLASKLLVLCPTNPTLLLLSQYIFTLARYDRNYDVRDRVRMLSGLLAGIVPSLRNPSTTSSTSSSVAAPSGWDKGDDVDVDMNGNEGVVGGVVLRREQIRVILFEGKMSVVEKDEYVGQCLFPFLASFNHMLIHC